MKTGDNWGSVGEKCGKFGDLKSKGLGNMILNCNLKMLWGIFRFYYVAYESVWNGRENMG